MAIASWSVYYKLENHLVSVKFDDIYGVIIRKFDVQHNCRTILSFCSVDRSKSTLFSIENRQFNIS